MELHSVTTWIAQAKAGESVAAQRLWARYLSRLVEAARYQLAGSPQQVADTNDEIAAQEAMSVRRVERKSNIIRKIWIHELRA